MRIAIVTSVADLNMESGNTFISGLPPYLELLSKNKKGGLVPHVAQLGPITLCTYLRNNGYEADVLDIHAEPESVKKLENGYDIIGIGSSLIDLNNLKRIAKMCRDRSPSSILVAGGQVATFNMEEIINKNIVDAVVVGEGEETLLNVVRAVEKGEDYKKIEGIYSEQGYNIRKPLDVKTLPIPDWSMLDLKEYIPSLPVQTMRGCPYTCIYCSEKNYWKKPIRMRDEKAVVEEIKNNVNRYGIRTFRIVDSCFTSPPKRAQKICDMIAAEGLDIKWTCYARADNLQDTDLIKSMKKAGCIGVDIGAESGSEKILKTMFKGITPQKIRNAIRNCKEEGLLVHTNFIIGFPGETKETINETLHIIRESKPDSYCFNPLFVFPGTELHDKKEELGIIGEHEEWTHSTMTSEQARKRVHEIFTKDLKNADANYFFGGEHAANVLASMNYNKKQIRNIYKSFNLLCRHSKLWGVGHLLLSKLGIGMFGNFLNAVEDIRHY